MGDRREEQRLPLVVVEGSEAAVGAARRELEHGGWVVVDGWSRRAVVPERTVAAGGVDGEDGAAAALLTALSGLGVLIHATGPRVLVDRLCDDLRRLGPVDHRTGEPPAEPSLTDDQQRLVELLAGGARLGEAAAALHLSRRSADRRLAEARAVYGVDTTAALLAEVARRRR